MMVLGEHVVINC